MSNTVSSAQARNKLEEIFMSVWSTKDEVVVTCMGTPLAKFSTERPIYESKSLQFKAAIDSWGDILVALSSCEARYRFFRRIPALGATGRMVEARVYLTSLRKSPTVKEWRDWEFERERPLDFEALDNADQLAFAYKNVQKLSQTIPVNTSALENELKKAVKYLDWRMML